MFCSIADDTAFTGANVLRDVADEILTKANYPLLITRIPVREPRVGLMG